MEAVKLHVIFHSMSTKELSATQAAQANTAKPAATAPVKPALQAPELDAGRWQAERREMARDFVTLKHTISQLRAERDRLAVDNRDLKMRLSAIETDYANLFSYVEGTQSEG